MRTLYDLLAVRPDDEALIKAYRKAAKAHHPDLNSGDPDAARRFTQITAAIEILRNPESRAAYDRQRRLRQTRLIIAEAIAAAVLVIVAVGRYALIGPNFSTSTTAGKVENSAAPGPVVRGEQRQADRTEPTSADGPSRGLDRGLTVGDEQSAPVERQSGPAREQESRQAAEREPQATGPEAAPTREQQERRQAGGRHRP
jgi:curved DNA-binding protein CbpA